MFNIVRKEIEFGGKKLILETGKIARQADGAVVVTYGSTSVLCTVVRNKEQNPDVDFLPLTVNYIEKSSAAGKIPSGFFKREGKASEKETLTSRLIDRPIRPLFPESYHYETQIICTLLSHDKENDPDVAALIGASAALAVAGLPVSDVIAASRIAYVNDQYILNPTYAELVESKLDLVVSGTKTSVLMVESEAKELSESIMLGAVVFGQKSFIPVIELIEKFASDSGAKPFVEQAIDDSKLYNDILKFIENDIRDAYKVKDKQSRKGALDAARSKIEERFASEGVNTTKLGSLTKKIEQFVVRNQILDTKIRIDGRDEVTIRPIVAELDLLPMVHGSALFTRGETQALVVTTLGTSWDEQIIDSLEDPNKREHFMLHYNFPPYSVGEVSPLRAPGRREIGHGKLALRALNAVVPTKEEFPYTIRLVSEITESNGSSSMATVCGASLSLMATGVPIKKPVAGIAMGLIKEGERFAILSDIMGDEDHLGDMDFKVAGTSDGVTALQMDIKIGGISEQIMQKALSQAKDGRMHILSKMNIAISQARNELSANSPRIETMHIETDKIADVIGKQGKVIKHISEKTETKIEIEDDGTVKIFSSTADGVAKAKEMIGDIVVDVVAGKIYDGVIEEILDFGAVATFLGKKNGMIHISELADYRVESVDDVVAIGDKVKIKVLGFDNKRRIRLSLRMVDQESGEDISHLCKDKGQSKFDSHGEGGGSRRGGGYSRDRGDRGNDSRGGDFDGNRRSSENGPRPERSDRPEKKRRGFF